MNLNDFKPITELEAAEIANASEQGRRLLIERDLLREMIAAKNQYIASFKTGKRLPEQLLSRLDRLNQMLFGRGK